ncbi:MAG: PaaI family thioesterase [Pseudomonadota bacterium]
MSEASSDDPIIRTDLTGHQRHVGYVSYVYPDRTEVTLTPDERHMNRHDVIHGGVVATLLDAALGLAASRHLAEDAGVVVVTVSMTINYIAATQKADVVATGRVVGGGYKTVFAEGDVRTVDGLLLATASGVFKRGKPRQE